MNIEEKGQIRKRMLQMRLDQDMCQKNKSDSAIVKRTFDCIAYQHAKKVLCFFHTKGEPDITDIILHALANDKTVVLPRITGGEMTLRQLSTIADLEPDEYQIPSPKLTAPQVTLESIDFALIPGLAFDRSGNRIGYGKGFFDKLFSQLKCKKIALCYDFQIVHTVPCEQYDEPVDEIISPSGHFLCKK